VLCLNAGWNACMGLLMTPTHTQTHTHTHARTHTHTYAHIRTHTCTHTHTRTHAHTYLLDYVLAGWAGEAVCTRTSNSAGASVLTKGGWCDGLSESDCLLVQFNGVLWCETHTLGKKNVVVQLHVIVGSLWCAQHGWLPLDIYACYVCVATTL
jgi:hypothetical protein